MRKGAKHQALERSRGGQTTKIHMLADAVRRPLWFIATAGHVHAGDLTHTPTLLNDQTGQAGDKAYDSNALRATIAKMEAEAVIPSNRSRKIIIPHDPIIYKHRNRHPIRASNYPLRRIHLSRRNRDLDTMNVDRPWRIPHSLTGV